MLTFNELYAGILFLTILIGGTVDGRKTGAPIESCQTLLPKHGTSVPQPINTVPYRINFTVYPYDDEEFVHVELYSISPKAIFRGFIVQARLAENPDLIADGNFVPADNGDQTKAYLCRATQDMERNNTWTHKDASPKTKVSAFWFPHELFATNQIIFMATVVHDKNTFWTGLRTDKIQMGELISNLNEDGGENSGRSDDGGENDDNQDGQEEGVTTPASEDEENPEDDPEGEEMTEDEKADQQPEPSNNVDRIVSSALTINDFGWSSLLSLVISLFIFRNLLI